MVGYSVPMTANCLPKLFKGAKIKFFETVTEGRNTSITEMTIDLCVFIMIAHLNYYGRMVEEKKVVGYILDGQYLPLEDAKTYCVQTLGDETYLTTLRHMEALGIYK